MLRAPSWVWGNCGLPAFPTPTAIATTVAAAIATTATAATTTATAATTAARSTTRSATTATGALTGLVDANGATVELRAVHLLDGGGQIGTVTERDETKTARTTGLTVRDDRCFNYLAKTLERSTEVRVRGVPAQPTYE